MHLKVRRLLLAAFVTASPAGVAAMLAVDRLRAEEPASKFHAGALIVAEPFTFATPPDATTAAGYMRIESGAGVGDRLLSATAEIAESVELQKATDVAGVTEVQRLDDGIEVPAGGTIQLRPGSFRLLLRDLKRQLGEGERFSGTLTFERAGTVDVTYQVGPLLSPIGGAFALTDQNGAPFSSDDLKGKPYAIFFGYTHCPDVCPATLFEMSAALAKLGDDAGKLRMVFVTVDPARDTPEFLEDYLSAFDPRIVGLTGTEEEIAATAKTFHTVYQKVPEENGDYSMDHSASVILMNAEGEFVGTISYREDVDVRVEKLKQLIGGAQ
jgi:protein SCO1